MSVDKTDQNWLLGTMDAQEWAEEFIRLSPDATDSGCMIGWFANAIMTGYDIGRRQLVDALVEQARAIPVLTAQFDTPELRNKLAEYFAGNDQSDSEMVDWLEHYASKKSPWINNAAADVLTERKRQIYQEGFAPDADDEYRSGELRDAAICYLNGDTNSGWPWNSHWWKPTNDRRDLIKAAALIIAEIERLDRAAITSTKE